MTAAQIVRGFGWALSQIVSIRSESREFTWLPQATSKMTDKDMLRSWIRPTRPMSAAWIVRGFGFALASLFGDGIRPARGPGSMSDDLIRRPQFLAQHQTYWSEK